MQRRPPIILVAALVQGWALFGLHHSLIAHHWPATNPAWLFALSSVAVFIPVAAQVLAEFSGRSALWLVVGGLALLFFGLGWHEGASVAGLPSEHGAIPGFDPPIVVAYAALWLLLLPFCQCALVAGRPNAPYPLLFQYGWRNAIQLAEGLLFTGLFWLILALWQTLFHMLGVDFFRELFEEPAFLYPVTALVFGCALQLVGSIDRLVSSVLEQLLNVLKWLGPVAITLLTTFTLVLVTRLPGLLATGERAIGAAWLLWLVALVVLLLNSAYRDGTVERPYPGWIARVFRYALPLTIIVSLTALYALIVRTHDLGLTVDRVWAFVVAGAAIVYSVGYSWAALDRTRWLGGIARINVCAALLLAITIAAALTPVLSPYRLAAQSQYRRVLAGDFADPAIDVNKRGQPRRITAGFHTPLESLRFDSGRYGLRRLRELASLQTGTQAAQIRSLAADMLERRDPTSTELPENARRRLFAQVRIFPEGRKLPEQLEGRLDADWHERENLHKSLPLTADGVVGLFVDLDGDGVEEFALFGPAGGWVYRQSVGAWTIAARMNGACCAGKSWDEVIGELEQNHFRSKPLRWRELEVGNVAFSVRDADD